MQLYEDFAKSQLKKGLDESVSHIEEDEKDSKTSKETPHIFQVSFPYSFFYSSGISSSERSSFTTQTLEPLFKYCTSALFCSTNVATYCSINKKSFYEMPN